MSSWVIIMDELAGIILAGGQSSRMGTNKALLPYRDMSLLDHMHNVLQESGVDKIYISGTVDGYDCLPDNTPLQGPAPAMRDLLLHFSSAYHRLVFVPVDMPLLTPDILRVLYKGEGSVYFDNHPLPACLKTAEDYPAGIESVKSLLAQAKAQPLTLPHNLSDLMANINTPAEWEGLNA